jgi:hypothetical protein
MDILIISIDHFVQCVKTGLEAIPLQERKDRLESLLRREISARKVQFIAEEAHPLYVTIAQRLGNEHDPQMPPKNIYMNDDERRGAEIYDALKNRPTHAEQRGDEWVEIEHRIPEDDIRKDFFVTETLKAAGNAKSIIILCGDMHVDAVKEKLERYGHRVEKDESLITDKRWVPSEDAGRKSVCRH